MSRTDQVANGDDPERMAFLESLAGTPPADDRAVVFKKDVLAMQGRPSRFYADDAHEMACCGCKTCWHYRKVNGIARRTVEEYTAEETDPAWLDQDT